MNCKRCGRRLKDKIAIERGYGSVCYQLQEEFTHKKNRIEYGWFEK